MKRTTSIALFAGLLALAPLAAHAGDIDTTVGGQNSYISNFGSPNTTIYGETFTVSGSTQLNSFSMYLGSFQNPMPIPVYFTPYIYAWDGSKATGSALFKGAKTTFAGAASPVEFNFATNGLSLVDGAQYVAFFYADSSRVISAQSWMPTARTAYDGGGFVFLNAGTEFGLATTTNWATAFYNRDVWFKADFAGDESPVTPVPEPSTYGLMGAGALAGLGLFRRFRNKRKAA